MRLNTRVPVHRRLRPGPHGIRAGTQPAETIKDKGRVEVDDRNEKTGYKIRESQVKKTPYTLVVGDQEQETGAVALRKYGEKDSVVMAADDFIALVQEKIAARAQEY